MLDAGAVRRRRSPPSGAVSGLVGDGMPEAWSSRAAPLGSTGGRRRAGRPHQPLVRLPLRAGAAGATAADGAGPRRRRTTRRRRRRSRTASSARTARGASAAGPSSPGSGRFAPGDRLRRISWPVSLRTARAAGRHHPGRAGRVGVLIVVDALRDIGHLGRHRRAGEQPRPDRAGRLRAGRPPRPARRPGRAAGRRPGRRAGARSAAAPGTCTASPAPSPASSRRRRRCRRDAPSSSASPAAASSTSSRRCCTRRSSTPTAHAVRPRRARCSSSTRWGSASTSTSSAARPSPAGLAWRMRLVERDNLLHRLAALGCPVVPWRGRGTVDDVLRQQARRGQRAPGACPMTAWPAPGAAARRSAASVIAVLLPLLALPPRASVRPPAACWCSPCWLAGVGASPRSLAVGPVVLVVGDGWWALRGRPTRCSRRVLAGRPGAVRRPRRRVACGVRTRARAARSTAGRCCGYAARCSRFLAVAPVAYAAVVVPRRARQWTVAMWPLAVAVLAGSPCAGSSLGMRVPAERVAELHGRGRRGQWAPCSSPRCTGRPAGRPGDLAPDRHRARARARAPGR